MYLFFGNFSLIGTQKIKFEPVRDFDYIRKDEVYVETITRCYSITVMEQYSGKSFEELRLEDKIFIGQNQYKDPVLEELECKAGVVEFKFQNKNFITEKSSKSSLEQKTTPFLSMENNQSTVPCSTGTSAFNLTPVYIDYQNKSFFFKETSDSPFKEIKTSFLSTNNNQSVIFPNNPNIVSEKSSQECENLNKYESLFRFTAPKNFDKLPKYQKKVSSNVNNKTKSTTKCLNAKGRALQSPRNKNYGYNFLSAAIKYKKVIPTINSNFQLGAQDINIFDTSNSTSSIKNHDHSSNRALVELNIVHDTSTEQTLDENNEDNNTQINETKESSDDEKKESNITLQPKSNLFQLIIVSIIGGFIINTVLFTEDLINPSIFSTFLEITLLITTNIWMMIEDIGSRIMNKFDSSSNTTSSVLCIILSSLIFFIFGYLKNNYGGHH